MTCESVSEGHCKLDGTFTYFEEEHSGRSDPEVCPHRRVLQLIIREQIFDDMPQDYP